jgi:hypothetical protein
MVDVAPNNFAKTGREPLPPAPGAAILSHEETAVGY